MFRDVSQLIQMMNNLHKGDSWLVCKHIFFFINYIELKYIMQIELHILSTHNPKVHKHKRGKQQNTSQITAAGLYG